MAIAATLPTTQLLALATTDGTAAVDTAQVAALVVTAPPATRRAEVAQQAAIATADAPALPQVSQLAAVVVVKEGQIDRFVNRAWTFNLDGHSFYVLQLGPVGTYVYDFTTRAWSQWRSGTLRLWNMFHGVSWNGRTVASDIINPILFELDADAVIDEGFRPITRIVTGAVAVRGRKSVSCDALYVTASVGAPSSNPTTLDMSFSDDQGQNFSDPFSITLDNDNKQQLAYRSLGQITAPGRIFKFKDIGGAVRLNDVTLILDGEEDG